MAWNQPGGQNNPWGRRPGSGGTAFEQRLKEWQRRLESLLRPGGAGEGGSLMLTIAVVIVLLWLGSGLFQVKAAERGVIQRFGRLVAVRGQGLGWHWPWPIETLTKINVANVNSSDYKSRVLTADINLVDLRFAVQFLYSDPVKVLFRVREPLATLRDVSESAFREIVGQTLLDDVLGAARPRVTQRTKDLIQRTLNFYDTGITVTSVNLTDVQVPDAVIASQRDANKALADKERLELEAQAYVNGILPVAQGEAARRQQEAAAYRAQVVAIAEGAAARFTQVADAYEQSPEVTRKRIYLETIENVLGRSHKVLIDGKSANGNLIYLPLDKLLDRAALKDAEPLPETTVRAPQNDSDSADGRSRAER